MKNKKMHSRHIEAIKIAYRISRESRSLGPMVLLVTRNVYRHRGMCMRGTLADYIEFCRMNNLPVQVKWGGILG